MANDIFGAPIKLDKEDRADLVDTNLPLSLGIRQSRIAVGAGYNVADQTDIAVEVSTKFAESKKLDIDVKSLARYIRDEEYDNPSTTLLKSKAGSTIGDRLSDYRYAITRENADIHEKLQKAGIDPAELRDLYLKRKEELKTSDERSGWFAGLVGGTQAFFSDYHNIPLLLDPRRGVTLAGRAMFGALMEGIVQSQVDSTLQEKAVAAGLGAAAPVAVVGIAAASKSLTKLFMKSKGKVSNFVKNVEKDIIEKMPESKAKEVLKEEIDLFKTNAKSLPKATLEDVFHIKNEAFERFTQGMPLGKVETKFRAVKGAVKVEAESIEELIDSMSLHPELWDEVAIENVMKRYDDFLTPSGKYVTAFEGADPIIKGTRAEAEVAEKAILKKMDVKENTAIKELEDGRFAVVIESDASYVPGVRSFKNIAKAEAAIPALAKKLGIPAEELSVLESRFVGRKESGLTYKIAQNASEFDRQATKLNVPHMFDDSLFTTFQTLTDTAPPVYKMSTQAADVLAAPELEASQIARGLDQIALETQDPAVKKLNGFLKENREALEIFKSCL